MLERNYERDGVDINTFKEQNELFASEVAIWHIAYGATVSAVHRED